MGKEYKQYSCGDKVFAKVRGYPPWPARIKEVIFKSKQFRYHVFFYGTYERGIVKPEDLFSYEENKEKLGAPQKRRFFNEGMREIEENPDIEPSFEFSPLKKSVMKNTPKIKVEPEEDGKSVIGDTFKIKKLEMSDSFEGSPGKKAKKTASSLKKTSPAMETELVQISRSGRKIKPKKFDDDFAELQSGKSQKSLEPGSEHLGDLKLEFHEEDSSEDNVQESKSSYSSDLSSKLSSPSSEAGSESEKEEKKSYINKSGAKYLKKRPLGETHKAPSQKLEPSSSKVLAHEKTKKRKSSALPNKLPSDRNMSKGKEALDLHLTKAVSKENKAASRESEKQTDDDVLLKVKPVKIIEKYQPKVLTVIAKSGATVDILYNQDKPRSFESQEAKEIWELSTAAKLWQCKEDLESGKYVPPDLESKLASINSMTDGDVEAKEIKESLSWLNQEAAVEGMTSNVVHCLLQGKDHDIPRCLESMDELLDIPIDPFMLVKNPEVILVIKKCVHYSKSPLVQEKAAQVLNRFKFLFDTKDDKSFYEKYSAKRKEFCRLTKGLSKDKRQSLTQLPVKVSSDIDDSDDSDGQDLFRNRAMSKTNVSTVVTNKPEE